MPVEMSEQNMILNIYKVGPDGKVAETIKMEVGPPARLLSESEYGAADTEIDEDLLHWEFQDEDGKIRFHFPKVESPKLSIIKVEADEETGLGLPADPTTRAVDQVNYLHLPNASAVISCQNCEQRFTTKYHYQRHTCEFNAERVVLKAEAQGKDMNKAIRMKFECNVCKKSFISNSNLERHKNCHKNSNENVCEHCNKTFVTENRLKIHKENHCKKTGDTTKFYRSDVAVWRCERCKQVFASETAGKTHVPLCSEIVELANEWNHAARHQHTTTTATATTERPQVMASGDDITTGTFETTDNIKTESLPSSDTKDVGDVGAAGATAATTATAPVLVKTITEMLFQCEFCNRTYASKGSVLEHQRNHTTDKNYECVACAQAFESFAHATDHWQNKCASDLNLFYLPRLLYCEFCDKSFKSHDLLYNHKNNKKHFVPKIQRVTEDGSPPATDPGLVRMIEHMIHSIAVTGGDGGGGSGDREPTTVASTGIKVEDTGTRATAAAAAAVGGGGKKKRGPKRKYPKPEMVSQRALTLGEKLQYQCERCVQCFDDIPAMDKHKDTAHTATHRCEQCGQVLQSAKALMIHSRAHQSLKPYVCDQCGRSYSQTSHLWQHKRFHQGIKPFACPHEGCEARYTIRPDLKDHIRKVHTRERPFKCAVCEKSFLTGSVYYQHRLIHTNDRRYGCEICNKRFFRADALNNHRRIHTDERPYPCPVCGREFRQKGDRNKHVRTQHSM